MMGWKRYERPSTPLTLQTAYRPGGGEGPPTEGRLEELTRLLLLLLLAVGAVAEPELVIVFLEALPNSTVRTLM